jgi:hypothetical protein
MGTKCHPLLIFLGLGLCDAPGKAGSMFMGAQCEKSKKITSITRGPKRRKKTSYLFDESWRSSPNVSVGCSGDALSLSLNTLPY